MGFSSVQRFSNYKDYKGHSLLNSMNREQHEGHEQGPLLPSRLSVPTLEGDPLLGLYLEPL